MQKKFRGGFNLLKLVHFSFATFLNIVTDVANINLGIILLGSIDKQMAKNASIKLEKKIINVKKIFVGLLIHPNFFKICGKNNQPTYVINNDIESVAK